MAEGNRQAKLELLAEWEGERDELNRLISRLRKDLGLSSSDIVIQPESQNLQFQGGAPTNVVDLVQPGDFFGMTQITAVRALLQRTNRQPMLLKDIAASLHRGKATDTVLTGNALRNLSSTMSHADDLISVAKGRWGLTEWYPGKAKAKKTRNKEDDELKITKSDEE